MNVLDATFLIDYGNEVDETAEYLLAHSDERFVIPSPVYTEFLLGSVHSNEPTALVDTQNELAWADIVEIDEETAILAAEIADEIGPEGPDLTAIDAIVAAVGRKLNGTVVTIDSDLTHEATKRVIDVEAYR